MKVKTVVNNQCPYCGGVNGYYRKFYAHGHGQYNFTWDGDDALNTDMHNCLSYEDGKILYCQDCEHAVKIKG